MRKPKTAIHQIAKPLLALSLTGLLFSSCSKTTEDQVNPGLTTDDQLQTTDLATSITVPAGIKYNYYVRTYAELETALKAATPGQLVYIADNASIDLTGKGYLNIKEGVTLMSGRTKTDASGNPLPGALLYTTSLGYNNSIESVLPILNVVGKNARIFGIRLRGGDTERKTERMLSLINQDKYYDEPIARGIVTRYPETEIKNCEIWGWSHAAIIFYTGATNGIVSGNFIHHNQRHGLGYGICLTKNSNALITSNTFDWNRHSISSSGEIGADYEAAYNTVLENANSHAFDVHGFKNPDGSVTSGTFINIHHNNFKLTQQRAFYIDGNPVNNAIFSNNNLASPSLTSATYINPLCKNYSITDNNFSYFK